MFGPDDFAAAENVSRETLARLKAYVGLLSDWNARHNLVSEGSMADVWRRHVWDSAQLAPLIPPSASTLADLGAGAGFPGMVLALLFEGRVKVTLFEATNKKCAFLREVAGRLGLEVDIRNERMETAEDRKFDVVTARACAPLSKLLDYAQHFSGKNTVCLFLKGENAEAELTEASKFWRMKVVRHASRTHDNSVILEINQFKVVKPKVCR
jgi:16S rRNA (guanine527-N7)-methyltransferase